MPSVLCSLPTRGRYFTTLPLVIQAIANQTRPVDKLVVFDDNDEPQDMRNEFLYQNLFWLLDKKKISWEWQFTEKKGQHHIHQRANRMGFDWVWRCDDDAVPDVNVLSTLLNYAKDNVGAIGGSILMAPHIFDTRQSSGKIDNISDEPNIQWGTLEKVKEVEHLHCSFLYRAGVHDYNLGLSRVAHREETLFSWGLHKRGYKLLTVPGAVTWHMKNPKGGIRTESNQALYERDEAIFRNHLQFKDNTVVVLNGGMGDHLVFNRILPEIKNPVVFGCYPEIIPCRSIAEAQNLFGDIDCYNIYGKMDQWKWKGNLEGAYRRLYL